MNDVGKNRALSSPFHKKIVLICNHVLLKNLDLDIADPGPALVGGHGVRPPRALKIWGANSKYMYLYICCLSNYAQLKEKAHGRS
jgi:hypothetical protein